MGGIFTTAPQVIHQPPNRIHILGQFGSEDTQYYYKYWDGSQWQPSVTDWFPKGGDCASAPALVSRGEGNLNIFGVSNDGQFKLPGLCRKQSATFDHGMVVFRRRHGPVFGQGHVSSSRLVTDSTCLCRTECSAPFSGSLIDTT